MSKKSCKKLNVGNGRSVGAALRVETRLRRGAVGGELEAVGGGGGRGDALASSLRRQRGQTDSVRRGEEEGSSEGAERTAILWKRQKVRGRGRALQV